MSDSIRMPDFIVIGAPKSGTTSLFYYLKQHPDIYLPDRKELHYFSYEYLAQSANGPGDRNTLRSLCATLQDYRCHYRRVSNERAIGEVSPSYLYYTEAAKRIAAELGKIKIIALLRKPMEKAYSQYMHLVRDNRERLSFYDALLAEKERMQAGWSDIWRYAESSLYSERLNEYFSLFGENNVKVLFFEDLTEAPGAMLRDLFRFLGVTEDYECDTSTVFNRSGSPKSVAISDFLAKPSALKSAAKALIPERVRIPIRLALLDWNTKEKAPMDNRSRAYLRDYFKDDVRSFGEMVGRTTGWL